MNDFIVTLNGQKREICVIDEGTVRVAGKEVYYEVSKISDYSYLLKVGNKVYEITTTPLSNESYGFLVDGHYFETTVRTRLQEKARELQTLREKENHHDVLKAPMPGMVLKLKKKPGDTVEIGESVVILEAMKMENDLRSPSSGTIREICVVEGTSVEKDTVLLTIE